VHIKVIDQNNSAIVGAAVTINAASGRFPAKSALAEQGEAVFTLSAGDYVVTATADGFAASSMPVTVRPGEQEINVSLPIAEASATVTVSDAQGYSAETISSATKTYTQLRDVPQSVSLLMREQIADQQITSVGDAVRYLPGITAHQGENNRDQVIIRGQSSSADFYVNGVRDDVQYYRDLYNLERLEVLRGPNAMIFGRGGGGGVVNRVTKTAGFDSFREIVLQGGSFGNKRAAVDIGQAFGERFAIRGNGVYENSNSFRDFVNLERLGINPTISFNPDDNTALTFAYEFFRDRRTADRGITSFQGRPADVPISTYYGDPNDSRVRADVDFFSATLDRRFGDLLVHNRTSYGDYDRFYQNFVPGAPNSEGTLVNLSAYNNATRRKNLFSQTDLTYSVNTGSIKHSLMGGFELGRQLTRNFRNTGYFNDTSTVIQVPFDDPTIDIPVTFRQSATDADNHLRTNLAAAYIQDQISITRYLQVIGGVRFDYFDLNYLNDRSGDRLRRVDRLVSPRLGVVIKPVDELSLYGSYSVSYLPSSGDQFSSLTTITQQVKPEKFNNLEAGVKWDVLRDLAVTAAVYRLDRTNTRATDPNDPTRIIQTGSQRTNGFEIGVNGSLFSKWSVAGGYAYQDAFITSATTAAVAGKRVAQVPHHNFSLWNKYLISKKLSAGLGIINRSDMFAAVDNTVVLPGYTRFDAAVFYTFNEHWRLQANVENLLDKKYYLNADNNNNISPGSLRGARVALTARF
jgi:catecholate siderophore receptor